jgi:hypothetical protein
MCYLYGSLMCYEDYEPSADELREMAEHPYWLAVEEICGDQEPTRLEEIQAVLIAEHYDIEGEPDVECDGEGRVYVSPGSLREVFRHDPRKVLNQALRIYAREHIEIRRLRGSARIPQGVLRRPKVRVRGRGVRVASRRRTSARGSPVPLAGDDPPEPGDIGRRRSREGVAT